MPAGREAPDLTTAMMTSLRETMAGSDRPNPQRREEEVVRFGRNLGEGRLRKAPQGGQFSSGVKSTPFTQLLGVEPSRQELGRICVGIDGDALFGKPLSKRTVRRPRLAADEEARAASSGSTAKISTRAHIRALEMSSANPLQSSNDLPRSSTADFSSRVNKMAGWGPRATQARAILTAQSDGL